MKSAIKALEDARNDGCILDTINDITSHWEDYDLYGLIIPAGYKAYFTEYALLLSKLPIKALSSMAFELMQWFQDVNWPGVSIIEKTLRTLPNDVLRHACLSAYSEAIKQEDEEWAYNLKDVFSYAFE